MKPRANRISLRAGLAVLLALIICFSAVPGVRAAAPPFAVESRAAFLALPADDTVLFEQNADTPLPIASITKVMTAILTLEAVEDPANTRVQIVGAAVRGFEALGASTAGFQYHVGEWFSVLDLLYGLLLPSGCEAAEMLAWWLSDGDVPAFAAAMTARAAALGCQSSYYAEPHGLSDENYSCCRDLYIMAKHALSLPYFEEIVGTLRYEIAGFDAPLENTNKLLDPANERYYCPGTLGIKTGYTPAAGRCLLSFARRNGQTLICVALGAEERYSDGWQNHAMLDSKALLNWGFEALASGEVLPDTRRRQIEFARRVLELLRQMLLNLCAVFGCAREI